MADEFSIQARFWSKVDLDGAGGCWLWTAATTGNGYGAFRVGSTLDGSARVVLAHRFAYEHLVGPIPEGTELDHLCRVRSCVRAPDHLEPVTHAENVNRGSLRDGDGVWLPGARNAAKTECPQGHPYSDENTLLDRGSRRCRTCDRARSREYQRVRRAKERERRVR